MNSFSSDAGTTTFLSPSAGISERGFKLRSTLGTALALNRNAMN